ncbi:MAG: CTP synthase, partial [Lentisphaeria bacterium]|nr:CTP synthase [Lentisphaeria bacterium]
SVFESLAHAGIAAQVKVDIDLIEAEDLENGTARLDGADGILVPGGFGGRGVAGKIAAIRHARERQVPLLGICLGMQCMVIEYCRHVLGWTDADSTEFNDQTGHPVIDLMPEQRHVTAKGGTMRLGAYPCVLQPKSRAAAAYGQATASERHRHRYELNNAFREDLEKAGLVISGASPDQRLAEIVELPSHPFFIGCQFHPEFKSRPTAAHPLFAALVRAALARRGQSS